MYGRVFLLILVLGLATLPFGVFAETVNPEPAKAPEKTEATAPATTPAAPVKATAASGSETASPAAVSSKTLDDFAQVYVNQFFEPEPRLLLSDKSRRKGLALARFAIGRTLENAGQIEEAIQAFLESLKNDPSQVLLARKTAHLLASRGRVEEGLALLEKSVADNPSVPSAPISLSEYLSTYRNGDPEAVQRAISIAEEAIVRFPEAPSVYEHLIALLSALNRRDDARTIVTNALQSANQDPQFWLRLGRIAVRAWPMEKENKGPNATLLGALFNKAEEFAKGDVGVIEKVGDFYLATAQFDRAISAYESCAKKHPSRLDLLEKLARSYGAGGYQDKEISALTELSKIDSENADLHKRLAGIYLRSERYKEAIPHLRSALAITKGTAEEYGALGRMMIETKEFDTATDFLGQAARLFPNSSDFPFLLTFVYSSQEKWAEAVEQFTKTIPLAAKNNPQLLNESFFFRYAAANERNGDFGKAEEFFRKTIEMLDKNQDNDENQKFTATVYNYLGYMWLENDLKVDEAGELIKTASELDPENGAIADSLGWFYFKKGRYGEAKDELLRAESLIEEEDAVIFDHIGQVYHQLGDHAKAIEYLGKAIALKPEEREYSERLESYQSKKAGAAVKVETADAIKKAEKESATPAVEKPKEDKESKETKESESPNPAAESKG